MSKENLDNFFQQKANQRSFEFEDDYWKEMELLLEDEEDKKTPIPFWWQNGQLLLGSLIAIMAIGALYVMLKQNSEQSNSNHLETVTQNNSALNSNNANSNATKQNSNNENITSINSDNTNNSITENSTNTLNNNSSNTKQQTTTSNTNNRPNHSISNRKNQNTVRSSQRNSNDKNNRPNSFKTSTNNNSDNGLNGKSITTKNTTTNNSNNKTSNNKPSIPIDLFSHGGSVGNSWLQHRPDGTLYSDYEKTLSEATKFNFLDLIGLSKIDSVASGALKTKLPKPTKPTKEEKTDPRPPDDFISIGLYAGGSRYFYNTDIQATQPYSPFAGIYANFPLSEKLAFGLGLNYWTRGNINASLSGDSTVYNFGFERITTTDFVSRATYLDVPLSLKYRIREKHIVEIGGNFSYLLTVQGSRVIVTSSDFGSTTQFLGVTNSYRKWLNSYDVALRLGYHYQWNERGTIGLQWQYGLTDVTPDNTFNHTVFDRNHQFRVRLAYDFIRIQTNKK